MEKIVATRHQVHENLLTPIRRTCDVLVIGGGAAGIMAAVSAARNGADTVLVETNPVLGGDMLAGGVSWLSYFNVYKPSGAEPKQLIYGLPYELLQRMEKEGTSPGFYEDLGPLTQESRGTHIDRERFKNTLFQLVRESGIQLCLNTAMVDAIVENGVAAGAVLQSRTDRYAILAKVMVDASGDGDAASLAGANCRLFASHGVGMAFGMSRVDLKRASDYAIEKNVLVHLAYGHTGEMKDKIIKFAMRAYEIPELVEHLPQAGIHQSFCLTSSHEGEATYINGVNVFGGILKNTGPEGETLSGSGKHLRIKRPPASGSNILDSGKTSQTIITLRENMVKSAEFLKKHIPGFENAYLSWTGLVPGARRTRYVECEVDISADDVTYGVVPEDTIGLFGAQDAHYRGFKVEGGKWYGIPYRALQPKFVKHLLVAGRMISSDWVAHMSTRLIGACFLQGQAAGTAAAMSARLGICPKELDPGQLRAKLLQDGVYLGD
jgi:hypothetical protein